MKVGLKPVGEQVLVITGGSSGIGLATAEMAAHHGARVVLTSRDEVDLEQAGSRTPCSARARAMPACAAGTRGG